MTFNAANNFGHTQKTFELEIIINIVWGASEIELSLADADSEFNELLGRFIT